MWAVKEKKLKINKKNYVKMELCIAHPSTNEKGGVKAQTYSTHMLGNAETCENQKNFGIPCLKQLFTSTTTILYESQTLSLTKSLLQKENWIVFY